MDDHQRELARKLGVSELALNFIEDVEPPVNLFDYDALARVEARKRKRRKASKLARRKNRKS